MTNSLSILRDLKSLSKEEASILFYMEKNGLISMFDGLKSYTRKENARPLFLAAIIDQLTYKVKCPPDHLVSLVLEENETSLKPFLVLYIHILRNSFLNRSKIAASEDQKKSIQAIVISQVAKIQKSIGEVLSEEETIYQMAKESAKLNFKYQFFEDALTFIEQTNRIRPGEKFYSLEKNLCKNYLKMDGVGKLLRFIHDGIDKKEEVLYEKMLMLIDEVNSLVPLSQLEMMAENNHERAVLSCIELKAYKEAFMLLEEMTEKYPNRYGFFISTIAHLADEAEIIDNSRLNELLEVSLNYSTSDREFVNRMIYAIRGGILGSSYKYQDFEIFKQFGARLGVKNMLISNPKDLKIFHNLST